MAGADLRLGTSACTARGEYFHPAFPAFGHLADTCLRISLRIHQAIWSLRAGFDTG